MLPSTAITRLDLSLSYSELSLEAMRRGFVGLQVLAPVMVDQVSANFAKVKVETLLGPIEDTQVQANGTYSRDTSEWAQDSYALVDHGVEEVVVDRLIRIYGSLIRVEDLKRQRAIHRLLQRLEYDISTAVFNTNTWTGASLTTAISTAWTTPSTATPLADIDGAIEKVKGNCAMRPNALILTDYTRRVLARTDEIIDLLKYSGRDDPKNLADALSDLFKIDKIIVTSGMKSTAKKGQDAVMARHWDATMAMVCRVADPGMSIDLETPSPFIGLTLFGREDSAALPGMDGAGEESIIMEEYREEPRRGGVIRARNERQVKILHAKAGHLLTNVTA